MKKLVHLYRVSRMVWVLKCVREKEKLTKRASHQWKSILDGGYSGASSHILFLDVNLPFRHPLPTSSRASFRLSSSSFLLLLWLVSSPFSCIAIIISHHNHLGDFFSLPFLLVLYLALSRRLDVATNGPVSAHRSALMGCTTVSTPPNPPAPLPHPRISFSLCFPSLCSTIIRECFAIPSGSFALERSLD